MEAATTLSPIDPVNPYPFVFYEPPLQPPFMASPITNDTNAGQNHDRSQGSDILPQPPPAPLPVETTAAQEPAPPIPPVPESDEPRVERTSSDAERHAESEDGSGSDHGESDAEAEDPQQTAYNRWQPIEEDKSAPCSDELAYIESKDEHSALDYTYWEKKIFFDLDDPEIVPLASGRIDWLVEPFNGTREKPNKEYVMRSPVVHIGGYDWRIKLYPRGNASDYLSAYLECVTMQSEDFDEFRPFSQPPLPFLDTQEKLKQRVTEAVQLGVVMYNPGEPRVYEYQRDAHQFTKKSPDYGWTRFTHYSRREFSYRMHGQRQAILRDDKLAFSAYIRIVNDPTSCMWWHGSDCYQDSIALTGLRPFASLGPMFVAQIPLLHFAPVRKLVYNGKDTKVVFWLQSLLWKMLSRTRSQSYGRPIGTIACDAVPWLSYVARHLMSETDANLVTNLIGTMNPDEGAAVGRNRLKTKSQTSVQSAIDAHPTPIATPAFLAVELERSEFDREARKWNKITNRVDMQNRIVVGGTAYILYGFTTHCGDLTSNKFNLYIRTRGPESMWYGYRDGTVTCLTHKQAVDAHCGFGDLDSELKDRHRSSHRHRSPFRFEDWNEVAHVVYYVRDDFRDTLSTPPEVESWEVPDNVKNGKPPKDDVDVPEPPPTAKNPIDNFSAEQLQEIDAHIERARQNSFDQVTGAATPSGWIMDGEDIVMGDADNESVATEDAAPSEGIFVPGIVVECLGREYYKGSLLGGLYHGEGHLIGMNGDEYTGAFVAGEKSGKGKIIYAQSGNTYEGQWLENKHHGQGTLTEAKTGNVFEGGWKNGKKSGQFVMKGTVTDEDKGCCSICYDKEINTAFYDCGHVLACRECAQRIDTCPICRRRVVARLELFGVKMAFD